MLKRALRLPLTATAVAVTGCSPVEPGTGQELEDQRLGVILFHADPVLIQVPDTARAGVPFEVGVRTYGNGCVTKDRTDVRVVGPRVQVRPFDNRAGGDCEDILLTFDHNASVTLNQPGLHHVEFRGRALPGDSVVTILRSVEVQ